MATSLPARKRSSRSPSPALDRRSSQREIPPQRASSSHRARSPAKERARSPKYAHPKSPTSPKRPRHAQDAEKAVNKEHRRGRHEDRSERRSARENNGGDSYRSARREHGSEEQSERRPARDGNDGGASRSAGSENTVELSHRDKCSSGSPPSGSKTGGRDEVQNLIAAQKDMNSDLEAVAKMKATEEALEAKEKQKPSYELSGKLAEETNRVRGITLLFTEPADARKPDTRWRLYVFKGTEALNDHPSCSKQHAVLQYRLVEKGQPDGLVSKAVKPYLMDLGSTNGSFINDILLEPRRYYELKEKDTIKFGNSSREYVLLHENSAG